MRLTEELIQQFSLGCIQCSKEKSGYTYARFTPGQVDGFEKRATRFRDRCGRTSGVRIDFDTDSRAVTVGVAAAGRYEIIVDGLAVAYKVCGATDAVHTKLPEGNKHVTIMLPWNGRGVIDFVQVDEGAYIRPHDFAHNFLFLGDSITQGSTAIRPSCTYVDRVARWFDANYLNLGVGGTKFFPELLVKPEFEPDTVFIAYGTNDFNSSPKEMFERECKEYMDTIKSWYPDKTVYVISPIWRLDHDLLRPCGTLEDVRSYIIEQAEAHGFNHIDGWKLVPHDVDYFADGRLHPNDMGMSVYAEQLIKALTK